MKKNLSLVIIFMSFLLAGWAQTTSPCDEPVNRLCVIDLGGCIAVSGGVPPYTYSGGNPCNSTCVTDFCGDRACAGGSCGGTVRNYYLDGDGDGYYSRVARAGTSPGTGWSTSPGNGGGDCDDNNASIYPDASGVCIPCDPVPSASISVTCNGSSWTMTASGALNYTWSPGFGLNGTTGASVIATITSAQTYTVIGTTSSSNCSASASVTVGPGTNHCSQEDWYLDADGDGYYSQTQQAGSSPGPGWTNTRPIHGGGDCKDDPSVEPNAANIHPNAREICGNEVDENCNGMADGYVTLEDCEPSFAGAVTRYFPNVGLGCPNGTQITFQFMFSNCYEGWTLFSPDLELLNLDGQQKVWHANKGQQLVVTVPSGFDNPNNPGVHNRFLTFYAQADGVSSQTIADLMVGYDPQQGIPAIPANAEYCGLAVTRVTFDNAANCDGVLSLVSKTPARSTSVPDGTATFHITSATCAPWSTSPWIVKMTHRETQTYFATASTLATDITVTGLPAGIYDVAMQYAADACIKTDALVVEINLQEIVTGTINTNSFYCPTTTIAVPFTINPALFNSSSTFYVELSDKNGDFANPTPGIVGNIGFDDVSNGSGVITALIEGGTETSPPAVEAGTGYRIRVVSTNPQYFGIPNGSDITIGDGNDRDGDGYRVCEGDCDDNPNAYPGKAEICNDLDDNCDGNIDEGINPPIPGTITCGAVCDVEFVCKNTTMTYYVPSQAGVGFQWTPPTGATISSGQGTSSVTINFSNSFTSGALSVFAFIPGLSSLPCGITPTNSIQRTTISSTLQSPGINGPSTICPNSTLDYTCAQIPGADRYKWNLTGRLQFASSGPAPNGSAIKVKYKQSGSRQSVGSIAGYIEVTAENSRCASARSGTSSIPVYLGACKNGDEEDVELIIGETPETETGPSISAFPNPFNDRLNIEFALPEDSRVKLEIFNVEGQLLEVLFDGEVKSYEIFKAEYNASSHPSSMVVYRLQTDGGTFYGKVMMVK